jgi:hypothetical protein
MKEELQQAFAAIKSGNEDQARVLLAQMLKDDPEYVPGWVLLSKLAPNNLQKAAFLDKILSLDPNHAYARQEMEALGASAASAAQGEPAGGDIDEEFEAELRAGDAPVVAPPQVRSYDFDEAREESAPEFAFEEPVTSLQPDDVFFEAAPAEAEESQPVEAAAAQHMPVSEEPFDFDAQAGGQTLPPWLAEDEELLAAEARGDEPEEADRMPPEPELPEWLKEEPAAAASGAPAGGRVRVREDAAAVTGERSAQARGAAPARAAGPPAWLINGLIVVLVIVFLLLVYFGIRLLT